MLVAFPFVADAQSRGRGQQSRARSPRAEALAPPPGLAEMLLPAGSRRPPTVRFDGRHDDWRRWPQESRGWWRQQQFGRQGFGSFYAVPYTGFSQYAPGEAPRRMPPPAAPAVPMTKGLLRVEITPAIGVEYYADGVFIGQSSQLGTQFEMNAGARQIEVRRARLQVTGVRCAHRRRPSDHVARHAGSNRAAAGPAQPRQPRHVCDTRLLHRQRETRAERAAARLRREEDDHARRRFVEATPSLGLPV